jgi:sec-independent protein translocase protein TatC
MSNLPDDDLFAGSTMSFGEHIEELRRSLFNALIGLMIGFGIGLIFANQVVQFIQTPLKDALTEYYAGRAQDKLDVEYDDDPPPEKLNMIEVEGKIPDSLDVDAFSFLDGLRRNYPGQLGEIRLKRFAFMRDDVELDHIVDLCRTIEAGKDKGQESAKRAVWDTLSVEQRDQIESLADRSQTTKKKRAKLTEKRQLELADADRAQLIQILNELIDQQALHQAPAFNSDKLIDSFDGPVKNWVKKLRKELKEEDNADTSRRLNRLLVASLFGGQIRKPHQNVIPVVVWKPAEVRVQTLNAQEAFMIWIKAAVISGLVIASPWIFWQIWLFVAAGLYPHERKYIWVFLPFSILLFLAGAAMAFFFVFEPVLNFLFTFNKAMNIDPDPRISEWLGFVLFLPVGFGISFQLPLVMLFLHRIGIFTVESYLKKWRIAILVIFVAAMLLTPADPVSMLLMAVPLTVLYFSGVGLCAWMPRIRNPYSEAEEG